jgi:hypothetical protein
MQVEVPDWGCTCSIRHTILFVDRILEHFGCLGRNHQERELPMTNFMAQPREYSMRPFGRQRPASCTTSNLSQVSITTDSAGLRLTRLSRDNIHSHQFHQPPWPAWLSWHSRPRALHLHRLIPSDKATYHRQPLIRLLEIL